MVGVGAANAGEARGGRQGVAFVCVEHFTGRVNPSTYGMGLAPGLLPLDRARNSALRPVHLAGERERAAALVAEEADTTTTDHRKPRDTA